MQHRYAYRSQRIDFFAAQEEYDDWKLTNTNKKERITNIFFRLKNNIRLIVFALTRVLGVW